MKAHLRTASAALAVLSVSVTGARASDHAEAPVVQSDQGADIGDVFAFLDPNDNSNVVMAMTIHGFVVPGENANFGAFDGDVQFRFDIENTGDAAPDKQLRVEFTKQKARTQPQMARVTLSDRLRLRLSAPTTVSSATSASAPAPVVTTDAAHGISFFAGVADDPFFYDLPAVGRFVGSALNGAPDEDHLSRGRDTFAGYNVQVIALRVPASLLTGSAGRIIGVSATTLRRRDIRRSRTRDAVGSGPFMPIDRMGVPGVATVLVPFARKDEYNRASTADDAAGGFAGDIVGTLTSLGTDEEHVAILAGVAVTRGDQLRLDTALPNSGPQGGTNEGAGFPNGRRPTDDVIDTILSLVTNGEITAGDHVDANDVPFRDAFPFVAAAHQPLEPGTIDDRTRN